MPPKANSRAAGKKATATTKQVAARKGPAAPKPNAKVREKPAVQQAKKRANAIKSDAEPLGQYPVASESSADGVGNGIFEPATVAQLEKLSAADAARVKALHMGGIGTSTRFANAAAANKALASVKKFVILSELSLHGFSLMSDKGLADIAPALANVTQLTLSMCIGLSDAGLAPIGSMTKLQQLDLRGCRKVKGPGLANLSKLTQLQALNLSYNGGNDLSAGLAHLRQLPQFRVLDLSFSKLSAKVLQSLGEIKSIEDLDITSPSQGFKENGLAHLKSLVNLRRLSIRCCRELQGPGLAFLNELPSLRVLEVGGCLGGSIGDGAITALSSACRSRLEVFDLSCCALTLRGVALLRDCTSVKQLCLANCPNLTPEMMTIIGELKPTLETLDLTCCDSLTDDAMENVGQLSRLRSLILMYVSGIGDRGVQHLASMKELRTLNLAGCSVTDGGLPVFPAMPMLEDLMLCSQKGRGITDGGLLNSVGLMSDRLKALDITDIPNVTDAGQAKLQESLPHTKITRYIANNDQDDDY